MSSKLLSLLLLSMFLSIMAVSSASHGASACSGKISQFVPAVMGQQGGLVKVSETLAPGNGLVYVTIDPRMGTTTQDSISKAIGYSRKIAGNAADGCDVLISFEAAPTTDLIDGPSAGAALTTMTYALFENRSMRNDTIMTGTIETDGSIGAVGGLYEKASSALAHGARYFIVPPEDMFELLLLKNIQKESNLTVLQAGDMEEVIGFMLDNKTIQQNGLDTKHASIPDPPQYDDSDIAQFRKVAKYMMDLETNTSQSISAPGGDNDIVAVKSYYENEGQIQERLYSRGYLFSAANDAFLDLIDVSTIKSIVSGDVDLARKKGELGICLTGLKDPAMDQTNMEWLIGADLRKAWANDKYNSTDIGTPQLLEEKFVTYHDMMYGQAWCYVAKALIDQAPTGGDAIDQSIWRDIASARIKEARALATDPQKDTYSRLAIAQDSFDHGNFGAAIYDSAYVREMENADKDLARKDFNASAQVDVLLSQKRTSLWGKIYQTQGSYLDNQNSTGSAYRILRFAKALDSETAAMREAISGSGKGVAVAPASSSTAPKDLGINDSAKTILGISLGVLAIILIIGGIILMTRGSDGDNTKGYRKIARAGKKEG